MQEKKKQRRTKVDLLEAGLSMLAQFGEGALTIDSLCQELNVTKGSFYHHFGSRNEFSRQLLEHWELEHTERFIDLCDRAGSAADCYCTLDALAQEINDDVEVAVRAWALRDPLARKYQERVDKTRMAYLHKLYSEMVGDDHLATLLTQLEYATFVGSRQIMPRPNKKRIDELLTLWTTMLKTHLKGGER